MGVGVTPISVIELTKNKLTKWMGARNRISKYPRVVYEIREDANQRDASLHDRSSGTRVLLILPVMQWCLAGCNYLERTVLNRQVSKHDVARASYSQRSRGAIVPNPKVFNNSAVF